MDYGSMLPLLQRRRIGALKVSTMDCGSMLPPLKRRHVGALQGTHYVNALWTAF